MSISSCDRNTIVDSLRFMIAKIDDDSGFN
jgi:hypothetical protein